MTLPTRPPTAEEANASLKVGSSGWPVYAIQTGLNKVDKAGLTADGSFGPRTDAAVKHFQTAVDLTADGIVGPSTKQELTYEVCKLVDKETKGPKGLIRNFARGEGGDNPAAVNWGVPGGVDCGLFQFRVYGPPYGIEVMQSAFDPVRAALATINMFFTTRARFAGRKWTNDSDERSGRCAVMNHNWPSGADEISVAGKCSRPTDRCTWVPRDNKGQSLVKFPDGVRVNTRWEWCQFYAMGGSHGEAIMCKNVTW